MATLVLLRRRALLIKRRAARITYGEDTYENEQRHVRIRRRPENDFNPDNYTERSFKEEFLFTKRQMQRNIDFLRLPDHMRTYVGDSFTAMEAICMVTYRISFPTKLTRMSRVFNRDPGAISRICSYTVRWIIRHWRQLLTWDAIRLTPAKLGGFASCIGAFEFASPDVFGFIDGTVRAIARPTINQESMFNGHKRHHALKYHVLVTPDGIISHMSNAEPGNTHDFRIYENSGLREILDVHAFDENNEPLAIFGDAAYHIERHVMTGYPESNEMTVFQSRFNKAMAQQRVAAEMALGKVVQLFSSFNFADNLRVRSTPVAVYFKVAVLLTNLHTCYNGSTVCSHFDMSAPRALEYMNDAMFIDDEDEE